MSDHRILVIADESPSLDRLRDLLVEMAAEGTIRFLYAYPAVEKREPCRIPRLSRRMG